MNNHFYNTIPLKYKSAYRDYYTLRNLVAIRTGSLIFFILNVIFRILTWTLPERLTRAQDYPEFNYTNWLYIAATPIYFIISYWLINVYNKQKKANIVMTLFVFLFSIYIVFCGMLSSFIATSDPRNALTLYLTALSVISVICVFEYYETLLLIVIIEILFTTFLHVTEAETTEMIYDQLISVILLFCFYFISRYFYAYKANYYMQLIEINEKNIAIEKAGAFKNEILGMVAHDLRNPIASIETLAMIMELDEIDNDTQENVNMIKASCVKARGIIDDLLQAANSENFNTIETQKIELNILLKVIINEWKTQKNIKNNIAIISAGNKVYAKLDLEKFQRVMDNLITNAVKFSKENDKIEIHLSVNNDKAIIEVKDFGAGIPADMLPHIFERFSKARRPGIRGEKSTGLGLNIVRQIIESHNGTIEVTSEVKKGSVFTIQLPITYD